MTHFYVNISRDQDRRGLRMTPPGLLLYLAATITDTGIFRTIVQAVSVFLTYPAIMDSKNLNDDHRKFGNHLLSLGRFCVFSAISYCCTIEGKAQGHCAVRVLVRGAFHRL
ncbi:unnamed protein product [Gongylonema pulchrum]|uniref:Proton_antipo_M domain-containing protein n=1 Tax=Gongylonema pulchrum TaxID=637853 RepID=A0A183D7N9_9BILA|nr:unnamed protein product [Gongylonema pulchrum]